MNVEMIVFVLLGVLIYGLAIRAPVVDPYFRGSLVEGPLWRRIASFALMYLFIAPLAWVFLFLMLRAMVTA